MGYQTGTAGNIAALFSTLSTFAVTNGWTQDHTASDRLYLTKSGAASVGFVWATTTPTCAAIYQHTAFISSGTAVGSHTNDSGQGFAGTLTNANLLTGRHVPLVDSTMRYWFFASTNKIDVVVEIAPNSVVQFGMGSLNKKGTWTGGAYAYGVKNDGTSIAPSVGQSFLLDGYTGFTSPTTHRLFAATVHVDGLPGEAGATKWALVWGGTVTDTSTDRGGNARASCMGGYRAGPIAQGFGRYGSAINSGLVPLYQIGCWFKHRSLARWYELGHMADVRGANIKNYGVGEEVVVGADTWLMFPARFKPSVGAGHTKNLGMAFKKVP